MQGQIRDISIKPRIWERENLVIGLTSEYELPELTFVRNYFVKVTQILQRSVRIIRKLVKV